ncbi:hypothetical protein BB560_001143 [Smittium megazygosporum]|uniref:Cyanate lyase C-terminal domain-containing protein n=1 Tax=Smittium megazygosporum TaxID=133381 RepID=A0A2T9ZIG0_9FUNG|nr:hypothetical protein BB560_001143 [Smittium megazygosporum]
MFGCPNIHNHAAPSQSDVQKLASVLQLNQDTLVNDFIVSGIPNRGSFHSAEIPSDPILYRIHEALLVYGPGIRSLILEKFGDGVMSAIDFKADLQKKGDPQGDRIVLTLDGKFLPYKKW